MTAAADNVATTPRDQSDPLLGRILAERYRVVAPLARGGMSRVYRGTDERLGREVALKVLSDRYAADPAFVERFLSEARTAAALAHPSLLHVYDTGSEVDLHFIVMELLDRHRSLRAVLDERGPLDVADAVAMARELLGGLRLVHDRGLVHCDVKAGNVMLGPGPTKLIDFGITRTPGPAGDPGYGLGSLPYMSLEQLQGEPLTPASDLFALGVVLYEAITGHLPFAGRTPGEAVAAREAGAVTPPSTMVTGVSRRLDGAILQALRADPEGRFHSAEAMDRALEVSLAADEDDETQVVAAVTPRTEARYLPPGALPPEALPPLAAVSGTRTAERRPARPWSTLATAILLGAAATVVLLVAVPLLQLGQSPGAGGQGEPTASAVSGPTSAPGTVTVPDTVGKSTADAIEAANAAGLNWTVRCNQDPQQPAGIIDQEPPAGTPVEPGARFTMYSARIQDCR